MPGDTQRRASPGSSNVILTGTRCTTLTKLPVAFSGGEQGERRTRAAPDAVDTPVEAQAGKGVDPDRRASAGADVAQLGFRTRRNQISGSTAQSSNMVWRRSMWRAPQGVLETQLLPFQVGVGDIDGDFEAPRIQFKEEIVTRNLGSSQFASIRLAVSPRSFKRGRVDREAPRSTSSTTCRRFAFHARPRRRAG
jgi:hypothetical protein